jgi:hypothetical protein
VLGGVTEPAGVFELRATSGLAWGGAGGAAVPVMGPA